jgi:E3 ubiquitin-protein ligase HUWE1
MNQRYRKLITLQTRVTLISEVYASAGHATGRTAHTILQALMGPDAVPIVPALGALHRACIKENIVLKKHLAEQAPEVAGPEERAAADATLGQGAGAGAGMDAEPAAATAAVAQDADAAVPTPAPEKSTPTKKNAQALKQLVSQIPAALAPLFQGNVALAEVSRRRLMPPL